MRFTFYFGLISSLVFLGGFFTQHMGLLLIGFAGCWIAGLIRAALINKAVNKILEK